MLSLARLRLHMRLGRGLSKLEVASPYTLYYGIWTPPPIMPHNHQVFPGMDIGFGMYSPRLVAPSGCLARQPPSRGLRCPGSLLSTMDALIGHSTQGPRSRRSSIELVQGTARPSS